MIGKTIDIKSILNDIRLEIKERKLVNDIHDFNINFDQWFSQLHQRNVLEDLGRLSRINPHKIIKGNKVVVFIKKIIRKIIKFYIVPIVTDQNAFNHLVVYVFERNFEMELLIKSLYEKIINLEKNSKEK